MKKYIIIQCVIDADNPCGAYVVVDTENDKILGEFDFKLEAQEFIKEIKNKP